VSELLHRYDRHADVTMSRQQVRDVDAWAIGQMLVPGVVLMENAGRSCAQCALEMLGDAAGGRAIIFCGAGNNGGDGFVVARHLVNAGCQAVVCICGEESRIIGDARTNLEIIRRMGMDTIEFAVDRHDLSDTVSRLSAGCTLAVDAVFGTGLASTLRPGYIALIEAINALPLRRLAVDIPSGLDCDTGRPMPVAVKADRTVTFVAAKTGFVSPDSVQYTGEVFVASIGIAPRQAGG
jgi:NAD(P)H-hydrate epimerase